MRWFNDGDRNTNIFHGRRKKLNLTEIQTAHRDVFNISKNIGAKAVSFFGDQFRAMMEMKNEEMCRPLNIEEFKQVAFELNGDNRSGPDVFSKMFYQSCWVILDINLTKKFNNVVVKLDMARVYDRVSWIFLIKVLRNLVSQRSLLAWCGDLSHIIEVLDRVLNKLHEDAGGHRVYLRDYGVLMEYKKSLGHVINLNKSFFYLHDNTPLIMSIRLKRIMGIKQGSFPFIYLGCSFFYDRKKMSHFDKLVKGFFWSKIGGTKWKHWVAWKDKCLPRMKFFHVEQILQETSSPYDERNMGISRMKKQGALYFIEDRIVGEEEIEVKQFIVNGGWDIQRIKGLISEKMIEYIVKNIRTNIEEEAFDIPWWMGNSGKTFTMGSFFKSISQKKDKHW
ncbi:hypothetical protein H5410_027026 [Solanum commersonii]|uniref:Reverse transcriptase n=1 Tax=Solanum commersonii TaxID=4109 RepID=A0A9J5Z379_SOLCO|nr:hypothetical protein H5410_027026 [Solanum commersonii]